MAKKSFGLVMLVAVLAFGMAVTGCDNNGGTSVSPIDGRWVNAYVLGEVWIFGNGSMRIYEDGVRVHSVRFTISGNNINVGRDTATWALSSDGNTLTFTFTEDGDTWTETLNRQQQ